MSYHRRSRDSCSPSPYPYNSRSPSPYSYKERSRSVSWSLSRSRSRSRDPSVENPGNNLYVTGLPTRVTKRDLEKHFSTEGGVEDVHLVVDPRTRESRGFGFVTMSTVEEADRCIKNLDRTVLEGRVIMVEKSRRRRGRTPTPGRYLGLRTSSVRRRSPSYSPYSRSCSPRHSSERDRSRSYSPYYRRRSHSPYYARRKSHSPYSRRSPVRRHDRSYSPCDYYGVSCRRYRSVSRSISPGPRRSQRRRSYSRSVSPPTPWRRRSYSRRISLGYSRSSRRRSYSPSASPRPRKSSYRRRHDSCSSSYSSGSPCSRSVSRSNTPSSTSRSS